MFEEDLPAFFQKEDRGILDDGVVIHAIFRNQFVEALGMAASEPTALCISTEVDGASINDRLRMHGTDYRIVGKEPDGTGMALLKLVKA